MNVRKNIFLVIGVSVALVLLLIAAVFLFSYQGDYRTHVSSLKAALAKLERLNTRIPYPSAENVERAESNLEQLSERYNALHRKIAEAQFSAEPIEPAGFAPVLEQANRRIRSRAREEGVVIPEALGLGFKDYTAGKLPPNDQRVMGRLIIQLKAMEDLINIAVDSKISQLDLIERDEFEAQQDGRSPAAEPERGRGRRSAPVAAAPARAVGGFPMPPSDDRYQAERFVIGITGMEAAIWGFLNRLVSSPVVYAVSDLVLENTNTGVGSPVDMKSKLAAISAEARQAVPSRPGAVMNIPEATMEDISREDRIVGGRDLIKARIVIDMFQLAVDEAEEGASP